jgi:LysR family transcriptional regulator, transcriptional activator of nhaA
LNYRHLHYFWRVARLGGVGIAARELHLTPQTLSGQIRMLEGELGKSLFRKSGRQLELTDDGRTALRFADAIFSLGGELEDRFKGARASGDRIEFRVGVTEAVPKSLAYRLIEPATRLGDSVRIQNFSGKPLSLLGDLAAHRIDLVVADAPMPPSMGFKVFNHRLGQSGVSFFAARGLQRRFRRRFPGVLEDMPLLVPGPDTAVAMRLRRWLDARNLRPNITGAFDDSALMKAFGQGGQGAFVAPTAIEADVEKRYEVRCIGRTEEVFEEFFAISVERRIRHPCVALISGAARASLSA